MPRAYSKDAMPSARPGSSQKTIVHSPAPKSYSLAQTCVRSAIARNETQRRIKHGRIRPMVEPSLLERLLGMR